MQVEGQQGVCLHTLLATGARVSNTYATCPLQRDNRKKFRLIPHNTFFSHGEKVKEFR